MRARGVAGGKTHRLHDCWLCSFSDSLLAASQCSHSSSASAAGHLPEAPAPQQDYEDLLVAHEQWRRVLRRVSHGTASALPGCRRGWLTWPVLCGFGARVCCMSVHENKHVHTCEPKAQRSSLQAGERKAHEDRHQWPFPPRPNCACHAPACAHPRISDRAGHCAHSL